MARQASRVDPESSDNALEPTRAQLRYAAMNLLARREQSALELSEKLTRRFAASELDSTQLQARLAQVLAKLKEDQLQSDERFAEAFVNMRKRQGKGPVRIVQELRQKGIEDALVGTFLDASDGDWWALAQEARERRFGNAPITQPKDRARQIRFLQYRGFTQSQIQSALRGEPRKEV